VTGPVLKAEGIRWSPGDSGHRVLAGVDLQVDPGELVALEGGSGAGKTVLGTLLLRLRPLQAGRLRWGEQDVTALSLRRLHPLRRRFQGMLQQGDALLPPYRTLRQLFDETARHVCRPRAEEGRVGEVVDRLGLTALLDRYPRYLSGGEQRRAGLARVLLTRPEFLLVDEPEAGLDPLSRREVFHLIRQLADRDGVGVLLVTHRPGLARRVADRRLLLAEGRLHAA
jgi:ABC-type glutathione transport system ATPase component